MTKWQSWIAVLTAFLLVGCPTPGGNDGGTPENDGGVTGDGGTEPGLEARPTNTSCVAPARPAVTSAPVTFARQFGTVSFSFPMLMLAAPGDVTNVFVPQRNGTILKVPRSATSSGDVTTFVSLTVDATGEGGLLGMAFHPNYATNREVFVSYTVSGDPLISRISRLRSLDNGATLDPSTEEIILTIDQPATNHNGGMIAFGPDGYLYIGFGDGGPGNDPDNRGQDLTSLLGKFLRIDVNGTSGELAYRIPDDNPFAAHATNRRELYAWGLRNPWRWSFDQLTGELWAGDVGQNYSEEIDKISLGGNYGWKVREGFHCRGGGTNCPNEGFIDPIVAHLHPEAQSITGGYVYRGDAIPSFQGKYVYGDYVTGTIWALEFEAPAGGGEPVPTPRVIGSGGGNIVSFAQLEDGEVYVVYRAGTIEKLVPDGSPPVDTFPTLLSQTGCFEPGDPTQPLPGLIPYELNAALWSDGAAKERFLALPDEATIAIEDDGDLTFPVGSVLAKTFSLQGKRVETRLLMRHPDGTWGGYTYEWNDAQTDATLLPGSKAKQVGDQTWYFPSRSDCVSCHTVAAGFVLGPELGQLNRAFHYASTGRTANQLTTMEAIGLFDSALPAQRPLVPEPYGNAPIAERAQAYLHANCSNCHRPDGTGLGPHNFVYAAPGGVATYCDVAPVTDLGISGARLLAPGSPAQSIISVRMHSLGAARMPPLASSVVDPDGTALIDGWIGGMTSCP